MSGPDPAVAQVRSAVRAVLAGCEPGDVVLVGCSAPPLVTPQQVTFPAGDGLQLHGQLFLPPKAAANGRAPAMVFFHGGSRRQMLLGWHSMYYYSNAYAMNQYLASLGYVGSFFSMISLITSISTSRSASNRLSRAFSFSNSRARFTSGSAIAPNLRFHM